MPTRASGRGRASGSDRNKGVLGARGSGAERTSVIQVKAGCLPGRIHDVVLNGGRTVEIALEAAEVEYSSEYEIRVNGSPAKLEDEVKDGDMILALRPIQGN